MCSEARFSLRRATSPLAGRSWGAVTSQSGISLIELVIFMVVVSVGVAGILSVMNVTTRSSADPMIQKQAIAIAEAMLDEIMLHPFTYCDPDDANVRTTNSVAGCASTAEAALTAEAGEARYSNVTPFDNVNDYAGFAMPAPPGYYAINDSVTPVVGLEGYGTAIAMSYAGTGFGLADNAAAIRIDVTVTGPANTTVNLTGYRFRYAPNAPL